MTDEQNKNVTPENNESGNSNKKTALGIDENVEALLCYVLGWLSGLIFMLIEKQSSFVKFHAKQSLVTFLGLTLINIVGGFIPFLGPLIVPIVGLTGVILWILLMVKAFQGQEYRLPIAADLADKYLAKF